MSVSFRLRRLDNRILGRPKADTSTSHRNLFAAGVAITLAVLLLAVVTGRGSVLAGFGGPLAVLIGSGIRWWRDERAQRRTMRIGLAAGTGIVLVASALTWFTYGSWVDPETPQRPAGVFEPEPTQFVQCDATPRGRAYSYQAPVSEPARCQNGADPRILWPP